MQGVKGKLAARSMHPSQRLEVVQHTRNKRKMEIEREELRKRRLCFSCKEPWDSSHRCEGHEQICHIVRILDSELDKII